MTTKTAADFTTRSNEEAHALALIWNARQREWNQHRQLILNTFQALWSTALSVEDVVRISTAIYGIQTHEGDVEPYQKELTKLVREKVLRSYVGQRGIRLYELVLS